MLAAAAAVSGAESLWGDEEGQGFVHQAGGSVNDQLGVAVIGARGRGNTHLGVFAGRRDTRVLYVCDVDSQVGTLRVEQVARRQGARPIWVADLRRALADPRVDIVSIATPNHWHALAAIWAMQAGKDVYVEKPVSHNVQEGRRMVEAARRHQRICQSGFQARSNPGMVAAIDYLQRGGIGAVKLARGLCYKRRSAVHRAEGGSVPEHVNYDLWLGPAAVAPLMRQRFHHDWHWEWPYGNGELGHQGVHQLDLCRWGLNQNHLSDTVFSYGGCFGVAEADRPADTLVSIHTYREQAIVMEVRGLASRPLQGVRVGVIFEGADGYVVMTSYRGGTAFDRQGHLVEQFQGGGGSDLHFANFLQAVRSRRCACLNADIEQGHLSSALAHTSNISYRLGDHVAMARAQEQMARSSGGGDLGATLRRTIEHLLDHGVHPEIASLRMGRVLRCDAESELFLADPLANRLLSREYRRPFVVPAAGSV